MALDFPNPPLTNGQTFLAPNGVTYTWDGVKWTVPTLSAGPVSVPGPLGVGVTLPSNALSGWAFFDNSVVLEPEQVVPGGAPTGHLLYNAYVTTGGQFVYLTNGPAFDLVFNSVFGGGEGATALRYAPSGTAGAPVTWQTIIDFQPGLIMVEPSVHGVGGSTDAAGHLLFNVIHDAAVNNWVYAFNGAGADIVYNQTTQVYALRLAPPGIAGQPITTFTTVFRLQVPTANLQTSLTLETQDETGTQTVQTVMTGPAGSGPGGTGRALYVAT